MSAARARPRYVDGHRRPEPRVERSMRAGDVYAAWCPDCESDEHTRWDHLPTLEDWAARPNRFMGYLGPVEALCLRCERVLHVGPKEAWYAREPERLEARLRELRAEAS